MTTRSGGMISHFSREYEMLPFLKSLFPEENASSEPNTADQGVRFITTQGINYYLDECLKKAQKEIILIAPYIKIEPRLREILMERKSKGVKIVIVCREQELRDSLSDIATLLLDRPTLHAKCYLTESAAIITSLNLYTFSQINNDEMGLVIHKERNESLYNDIKDEALRLCHAGNTRVCKEESTQQQGVLQLGKEYEQEELNAFFGFSYKGNAGIKQSERGDIVLFIRTGSNKYQNEEKNGILYFQGQNTGEGEQKLIYGNKLLYDCYQNRESHIFLFRDNVYSGKYFICQQPYMQSGKWFFPLRPKTA